MNDITPVTGPVAVPAVQARRQNDSTQVAASTNTAVPTDKAEFSEVARYLSKLAENPTRPELIDRVQSEIGAGSYVTSDKIDALLDELLTDLDV